MIPEGEKLNPKIFSDEIPQAPTRNGYGEGVVEAGKRNKDVIVLCADLTESTRSDGFRKEFPERFVEMGVAEQNMASVASGMAAMGKIPFISSYAMFSPGRNWEQVRTTICYNDRHVVIVGAHAGVSVGPDGATHQAIEDIAITRPIANMQIIVPCDAIEGRKATITAAELKGPVYMRFAREKTPVFTTEETPFILGKAEIFFESDGNPDIALIACGPLLHNAILAAEELERNGLKARVINNHTIKPMDEETIIKAAKDAGCVVTIEEHQVQGGMGSRVAEILALHHPVPIEFIGVQNRFGESGEPHELLEHFGMGVSHIKEAALQAIERKNGK